MSSPPTKPDAMQPLEYLGKRARLTPVSSIEPQPVTWGWQDRIPMGSLTMAAGREGTGKSQFSIHLAACISNGTLPGAFEGEPRNVVILAGEDSYRHTIAPRLIAAGADCERVYRMDVTEIETGEDLIISLPVDNRLLEDALHQYQVALTILDPLISLVGSGLNTHNERETRQALDPLVKIADRTGSMMLGIGHFNKSTGNTDAASLITGSGAFKNVPRAVFGFVKDTSNDSGDRVMTQVKNSLGRDDLPSLSYQIEPVEIPTPTGQAITSRLIWTGESDRTVSEVLADSQRDPEERQEAEDCASFIRSYLTDCGGSAPSNDVMKAARAAGFTDSQVRTSKRRIKAKSERHGFGPGATWYTSIDVIDDIGAIDAPLIEEPTNDTSMDAGHLYQFPDHPIDDT